jgi:oxygen-independent coproporphyrinogen III oxidase
MEGATGYPLAGVPIVANSGLYIHVPFCRSKCIYCDFYSVTAGDLIDRWLSALEREMAFYDGAFTHFDSLFIGGGTPSLLSSNDLETLFSALHRHFTFSGDAEISVEVNPDDASPEWLAFTRALGVNRISFGIQSFNDKELAFLRRRHDAAGAKTAITATHDAGFTNVGLDLIYGLPGQTKGDWLATLEQAVSFKPTHLSCYQLTVDGDTPLKAMIGKGSVRLPGDEKGRALFLLTSRFLVSHGFAHYEVSNFSSSPDHACRHNEKYWRHAPYLGLGPSAHSFDGARRWWNYRSVERYCDSVEDGAPPVEETESLSGEQLGLERLYLGLRTSAGVSLDDLPEKSAPAVRQLKKAGLVRLDRNRIIPTVRGYLVADSLPVLLSE